MGDDGVSDGLEVLIVCPECNTRSSVQLDDARSSVDRHNDRLHDGDSVATIDPALKDELARLVAEDLELL